MDIYLRFKTGRVHRTVDANPNIILDLDKDSVILGAEILNVQEIEIDGTKVSKTWVQLARMVSEMTP